MTKGLLKSLKLGLVIQSLYLIFISLSAFAEEPSQSQVVSNPKIHFDIPQQDADVALTIFGKQADISVVYRYELVQGKTANPLVGNYSLQDAVEVLLHNTGLIGMFDTGHLIILKNNGHPKMKTKKTTLTTVMAALFATSAAAQETNSINAVQDDITEVIQITGIRGSLAASQAIKRSSNYAVDAITNEDIGKFPDNNVAEALQRIPGFAISRSGGEGQQVTVRGFGPEFNTVLWNGRRIATDAVNRAFNFDTISADMLGGTEVYKTTNVALQEGGIGSTINLQTFRPLAHAGFHSTVSVKGLYDKQADETTPAAFAFISNTFADNTIGLLFAASFNQRKTTEEYAETGTWIPADVSDLSIFQNGTGNGAGRYWFPEKLTNTRIEQDRERTSLNATIQYMPSDDIAITFDALYTEFDIDTRGNESAWFGNRGNAIQTGTAIADSNNVIVDYRYENGPEFVQLSKNRPTETLSVGMNIEWFVTDEWTTTLDLSHSEAENNAGGTDQYFVIHGPQTILRYDNTGGYVFPVATDGNVVSYDSTLYPAGSPQLQAAIPVGATWDRNNLSSYRTWWSPLEGTDTKDEISELRFDNKYEVDEGWLESVRFGASYSKQEKYQQSINSSDVAWGNYGGTGIPLPSSLLYADNHPDFLNGSGVPFTGKFVAFDGQAYLDYLLSDAAFELRDQLHGLAPGTSKASILPRGFEPIAAPGAGYTVEEVVWSVYAEATFVGELGNIPTTINVGFRYSDTDESAESVQKQLTDILIEPSSNGTQYNAVFSSNFLPVVQNSQYSDFQPSVNAKFELTNDLVGRVAFSKSISRPPVGALNPVIVFPQTFRPGSLNASGGNGDLQPYSSTNFDTGLEWYYADQGYISVAYFKKNVDGLIANSVVSTDFTIANTDNISTGEISGNTATLSLAQNVNLGELMVDGIEIAVQHQFDWAPGSLKNAGFTATATLPDSDADFDRDSFSNNSAFPGLSDSYNATLYYDDGTFEGRIAWTRRDEYFDALITGTEPRFVKAASQVDVRLAYNLAENFQVFISGINLGDTPVETVGRYSSQALRYTETGPRYEFGIHTKF